MLKTFILWMEDQNAKRRLIHTFLDRIQFGSPDQVITDKKQIDNILDKINSMDGINDENKEEMRNYVLSHHNNLSLKALVNMINPLGGEIQDRSYSQPAVLPQGTQPAPKPLNNRQMQQQQQQQQQQPMV